MKLNALISAVAYGTMCMAANAAGTDHQPFLPVSDFSATVKAHNIEAEVYHRELIFRIDAEMEGGGMIMIVDVPEETQTIFMNMGGQRIATMVEWGQLAELQPLIDQNPNDQPRLAGSDAVAGEPCDIYFVPDPKHASGGVNVCFTHDGVPLRMDDAVRGVVFEVTRFDRSAQDPALFVAPVGYQMMQMPGGMNPFGDGRF